MDGWMGGHVVTMCRSHRLPWILLHLNCFGAIRFAFHHSTTCLNILSFRMCRRSRHFPIAAGERCTFPVSTRRGETRGRTFPNAESGSTARLAWTGDIQQRWEHQVSRELQHHVRRCWSQKWQIHHVLVAAHPQTNEMLHAILLSLTLCIM